MQERCRSWSTGGRPWPPFGTREAYLYERRLCVGTHMYGSHCPSGSLFQADTCRKAFLCGDFSGKDVICVQVNEGHGAFHGPMYNIAVSSACKSMRVMVRSMVQEIDISVTSACRSMRVMERSTVRKSTSLCSMRCGGSFSAQQCSWTFSCPPDSSCSTRRRAPPQSSLSWFTERC